MTKPDGNGLPYAFVCAEEPDGSGDGRDRLFVDTMTDANGNYTLDVPAGTFEVFAGLPPTKMITDQLTHPAPVEVTIADDTTETVNLQFGNSDATISGTVRLSSVGVPAFVWAWSDNGGYAEVDTAADGTFTLPVKGGNTWHVGAGYESDSGFYTAAEQEVTVAALGSESVTLNLSAVTQTIPDAVSVTFAANQMKVIDLSDGTKIQIPAGALAASGNITVIAKPKAGLRKQKDASPIGLGYELKALDSNGQEITDFISSVTITFPYDPSSLPAGVSEDDLVPAYWDETSGTWQKVGSAVIDTTNNTITVKVDHFSLWGNIAKKTVTSSGENPGGGGGGGSSPDTEAPATPTSLAAVAGKGKVDISWNANKETDLSGYNLYRAVSINADQATKIATLTKSKTGYTDMAVIAGTTYYYWLSAFDSAPNESAKAGPVSAEPTQRVNPFNDIVESHWAYNYILDLTDRGIISGYADSTFRPSTTITRAEFAKMMCLTMGWEPANPATPSFTDVAKDSWAYRYIETAKANGVIGGYQDGTFKPTKQITRAEIAKIVVGTLNLPTGDSTLTDIDSHWAKDLINSCVKAGIVSGYQDGSFKPNNTATRAEAAKMVVGVLNSK